MIKQLQEQIEEAKNLMEHILQFELKDWHEWVANEGEPYKTSQKAWDILLQKYNDGFCNNDKFCDGFAAKTDGHIFCNAVRLWKMLKKKQEKLVLYTVVYSHEYGEDVAPFLNHEKAYEWIHNRIEEWRDDFNIPKEMSIENARNQWVELTDGQESFEITDCIVEVPK